MIDYKVLKRLVIEAVSANPHKPVRDVLPDVEKLAVHHNVFPSDQDSQRHYLDHAYYRRKQLSPIDKQHVHHIIWQMVRDNLLTIGNERLN